MKLFRRLVFSGAFLFCATAHAQTFKSVTPGKPGMFPAEVEYVPGTAPANQRGLLQLPNDRGALTPVQNLAVLQAETDVLGYEHVRYQQHYLGIPVEHAYQIIHSKGGSIIRQNGKLVQNFGRQLSAIPAISEAAALQFALASIHAQVYKWQVPGEEAFLKAEQQNPTATFYPTGSLVFYSGEEEVLPDAMRLAYKFDIYAQEPISRQIVFVDAATGTILGSRSLLHEANANGTAVTGYSGTQPIVTDSYNGSYRLRETGRGNGIQTFNLNRGTNYGAATDFTDADNNWNNVNANKDQYATDAHWGAEKTYDYFKVRYNRNSIDNAGFAIKSYVHYSTNYFNAFWDGSRMTYGDGSASYGNKPLTSLDVCGHEISHGLTSFSSNLVYSYESGALNEGFSDIFGTAIEFYARPGNANWLIGSDFYTIRSMSNPNAYGDPDTYQGTNWISSSTDNGGVHTNSGVLNYWFYLLSIGGSGTNDKGTAYNVTGIGIDKAGAIAFRLNTVYLISTSKYADARTYGIKAAEDLYGVGSAEAVQTANAWTAVGVGGGTPTPTCTDNYEANETRTASKTISVNTAITAKIGTSTDKDWFTFTTTSAAPKVKITLTNLPADYDVRLYNSAGTQLAISQNGSTTSETITYNTATSGATYYVQVYGYNGASSTTVCYSLLAAASGTNWLGDDEEDDANIGLMAKGNATSSNGFTLQPVPATDFTNVVFSSKLTGRANVLVTDATGTPVKKVSIGVVNGTNRYQLSVNDLRSGTYFVKVIDQNGTAQVQKLIVQH
jgi:bacillolysin